MDKKSEQLEQTSVGFNQKIEKKENLELEKKLDILTNSELKSFFGFDKFISYLSSQSDTNKLDAVIKLLQNPNIKKDVLEYLDVDSFNGKGFFDENTYKKFFEKFKDNIVNQGKTEATQGKTEATQGKTEVIKNDNEKNIEVSSELNGVLNILKQYSEKHGELKIILKDLEVKNTEDKIKYLGEKQDEIFKILIQEAGETKNGEDAKQVALTFKNLGIIDTKSYNQIYKEIDIAVKGEEPKPKSLRDTQKELAVGYTQRGDTLYKSTDKTSFTIEDGKITSVSKDSGFKLTDYSTLDEDGKKLTEKMKLEAEIKELTSDLTDNNSKKEVLDRLESMLRDINPEKITKENINMIIAFLGNSFPLVDNQLLGIYLDKKANPQEKLQYIIKLLFGHITGSTDTSEINGLKPIDQINLTKNKIIEKDSKLNKSLLEKQKKLEEFKKLYPNLDEKSIQEKIKTQETKMQDTIKFCDEYGLSSLGHIAYIKQVIREYNKNEVERKIPEDIGSSTEFLEAFKNDKDGKLTESLKKIMAKLVGKEVKDIFKDGNLGLNTIVRSTFDSDTGSAETINKPYLERLLKEKGVLKKNSGELNIYKVQELLDD